MENSPIVRTNLEVLEWIKRNEGISQQAFLEEAQDFFGSFSGGKKKLSNLIEKLKEENKKRKRRAHTALMKECGGTGKEGSIPPTEYVPDCFANAATCKICGEKFKTNCELREHAKSLHNDEIIKVWSKDALLNVGFYEQYKTWLGKYFEMDIDKLPVQNDIVLPKFVENNSSETLLKVSQKGNIIETRREIFIPNKDGTLKKSVLTEQYANVSKRKHENKENEDPNKVVKRTRHQSQGLNEILEHMSGGNVVVKTKILAGVIDTQGADIAEGVAKCSKQIKQTNKFTKEKTAALISASNLSDYQLKQLRTACNKELGNNPFASAHKVSQARNNLLSIDKDDWETTYHDLYRNKMGKNADKKKRTCVLNVKNLKSYIQKVAVAEKDNLVNLKSGDSLQVCWDGDGGGGRFVAEFAFINNADRKITLHPFLIFEGTDVRANLEVTLGRLTKQIKELEGATINIEGKELKLEQFGVFDLCALNTILGKQNHSATFFDAWTDCTLEHLRNHSGRIHSSETCKEIKFLTLEDLEHHLTNHSLNSLPQRKTGRHHGNVIGENLIPLNNIFRYVPPLMHIIMGLGNDVINELKREVNELDEVEAESGLQKSHMNDIQVKLKKLYDEQEILQTQHSNNALDKCIAENDLERIHFIKENKVKKAAEDAKKRYKKGKSKNQKSNCDSGMCVIFQCDEENGFADMMICHNGCNVHKRCEGIVQDYLEPECYICKKCMIGKDGSEWLEQVIKDGIKKVSDDSRDIMRRLTEINIQIEKEEHEESKCGERQKKLKESMKKLKINPAIYHGGDFEGKAIQKMLDCARDKTFTLLQCVSDKPELHKKFKKALTTLHEVSDIFKSKIEYFSDDDIKVVKILCEKWGKNWPIDFPNLNITPKGHNLVWVLPEILKHIRSFYMFYKVEEKGESIHADLNSIQRKIWCIRDPAERLWKYIERYELKNCLETSIVTPIKRNK